MSANQSSRGSEPMNMSIPIGDLSPPSNADNSQLTFRVQGIPLKYKPDNVKELLRSVLRLNGSGPNFRVRSLAISHNQKTKVATVDFEASPACLALDRNEWSFEIPDEESSDAKNDDNDNDDIIPMGPTITIDKHFKGITVLRSFRNVLEHKIDCVAVSGLGSHAFGSFKERAGTHMWLRDALPHDLPTGRIMLYGYDTKLHNSHSFQDLEALASTLRLDLQTLATQNFPNAKPSRKPLIFIAHSLGGIVVKEAIIQIKRNRDYLPLLDSIYGALFFGVPNNGLDISSLIPMVEGQPNQGFLLSLSKESQILRNQSREFPKAFDYQGSSEIYCFYETEMSPTAARHGAEWKMTGPPAIFVDSSSARHGRPWENEERHCVGLKRTHSELVKFSRNDGDYGRVLVELKRIVDAAVKAIPRVVVPAEPVTRAARLTLEGHSDAVFFVAFSPDGKLVGSGSWDKSVRLWDSVTGVLRCTLKGHSDRVTALSFSPDGKLVASGSKDGLIRLWDCATGTVRATMKGHTDSVAAVVFSPDGKAVASGSWDKSVRLWDSATGALCWGKIGHSDGVNSVAFSPDGTLIASGSKDAKIRIWIAATGAPRNLLWGNTGWIIAVKFSPDGKFFASASADTTVGLWDTALGVPRWKFKGHSVWVRDIAFSPDSKLVASASADHTVRLWDCATGVERHTLRGHSDWVLSVAFSPNGKEVVSASNDGTVRLWDSATGVALYTLKGHLGKVKFAALSPDGKVVASASEDRTVRLWDSAMEK